MQYRNFGKLDWQVSALGFGAMRFPIINDEYGDIDEEKAIEMVRYAIDQGVNYVDTAWPYHKGNSEIVVGKALQDGYREKVKLATKLPTWLLEKPEDMDHYLDQQLEKLQTDHIDFYLIHALRKSLWEKCQELKVLEWLQKVQKEGKIKHIGFSFHDNYDTFVEIVDSFDWDFCQIQYNYMDTEFQAGKKGLKYAADQGLAVVIMEPLRGGALAAEPPQEIQDLFSEAEKERKPADWALQWVWNQPEVSVVLSGMSTLEQVKENIESASNSAIDSLSEKELDIIDRVQENYRGPVACTRCEYCMPCPNGVEIPRIFFYYNQAHLYDEFDKNKERYQKVDEGARADQCIECGQCEEACPQQLSIMAHLADVAKYFD